MLVEAKRILGIDRLVLQIQDASFPADADEDIGRGSPYSRGAERFFRWAAELGFDVIQFGPRGMTGRGNPSPYDATIFSRNPLDLPLHRLVEQGRLSHATWEAIRKSVQATGDSERYARIFDASQHAQQEICARASAADRASAQAYLSEHATWLIPDALYGLLCREHGSGSWLNWGWSPQGAVDQVLYNPPPGQESAASARVAQLRDYHSRTIEDYALIQWLLSEEQRSLRAKMDALGLSLYGDLQVGLSLQDTWSWQRLFLDGYRMGAPPSRTNPEGQPWGYNVLDPAQFGTPDAPGPALDFVRSRIARALTECDGVRIDHPHGWIDPWVYRSHTGNDLLAVQSGARLFSSPNDPQHPELARYAIARPDQIDGSQPLYADGHVTNLEDEQTARYSILIDQIIALQQDAGQSNQPIACEVLSTLPYPVGAVMQRHGLGRFRVTQKLSLTDPSDVYRIENARPQDWIMLGTHDTPPIWQLAEKWCQSPAGQAWGEYLSELLAPSNDRPELAERISTSPGNLVNACFTAMLKCQTRHIVVFFPDLLGMTARYNEPGLVSSANWSLRAPADFESFYQSRLAAGAALDLRECLQRAVRLLDVAR